MLHLYLYKEFLSRIYEKLEYIQLKTICDFSKMWVPRLAHIHAHVTHVHMCVCVAGTCIFM